MREELLELIASLVKYGKLKLNIMVKKKKIHNLKNVRKFRPNYSRNYQKFAKITKILNRYVLNYN